jgi:hypothetical protein
MLKPKGVLVDLKGTYRKSDEELGPIGVCNFDHRGTDSPITGGMRNGTGYRVRGIGYNAARLASYPIPCTQYSIPCTRNAISEKNSVSSVPLR